MSYATYTTEALVCGAFDRNTADRTYLLYTREAGMLYADAKSVREERSKQRYALQEFSHIRVSLVKGKRAWKIGSVEVIENDYRRATSREARGSVVLMYRTLRRFIHGEEASAELFDLCVAALRYVTETIPARTFFEAYLLVAIMRQLGYVNSERVPHVLRQIPLREVVLHESPVLKAELDMLYQYATEQSQL